MNKSVFIDRIISEKVLPANFIRFYTVGLLLFILPITRQIFFQITAISILLVIAAVLYHHKKWTFSSIAVFLFIAVASFLLEVRGVATGTLFGNYQYDTSLGIKLWNTPLLIGINWVFLVYASQAIVSQVSNRPVSLIIGSAFLMVIYDAVMEFAAPHMHMWHFSSCYPPVENFVVWLVAALLFHTLFVIFKVDVHNRSARALFWSQLLFFALISLYSLLFIE